MDIAILPYNQYQRRTGSCHSQGVPSTARRLTGNALTSSDNGLTLPPRSRTSSSVFISPLLKHEGILLRFESTELLPGRHVGTVGLTKDGGVMIWKATPELTHGRIGFSLTYIQKLERQDGEEWVEVPITPMAHNEPKQCQEPTG